MNLSSVKNNLITDQRKKKKAKFKLYEAACSGGNCSGKRKFTRANFSLYYFGSMKVSVIVGTVLVVNSVFM